MALTDSLRNRKVLANAIGVVLAGNVVALFVVGDGGRADGGLLDGPAPAGAESSVQLPQPATITLVTDAHGRKVVVDPSTSQGRAAIERAVESGGSVATVPTTSTTVKRTTTTTTKPKPKPATRTEATLLPGVTVPTLPDVPDVTVPEVTVPDLGSTVTTIQTTVTTAVGALNDAIEEIGGAVDGLTGTNLGSSSGGTVTGITSGGNQTGGSLLNGLVSTAETTVETTGSTVVGGATGTLLGR